MMLEPSRKAHFSQTDSLVDGSLWMRGLAHDLCNVIQATRSTLELLQEEVHPERLLTALNGLDKMTILAQCLQERFCLAPVPWSAIKQSLTETLTMTACRHRITWAIEDQPHLPRVLMDLQQIQRAFLNLLWNACDAVASDGRITVSANVVVRQGNSLDGSKTWFHIAFSDNGSGIAPEHLEHLFDLYYTTKPGGHGLGLATVRSIIQRHGGRISVDSELGRGTVFHLFFPLADIEPAPL